MDDLKRELTAELPKELERARAWRISENAEWAMYKQRWNFCAPAWPTSKSGFLLREST
jgi:hypothetical protein